MLSARLRLGGTSRDRRSVVALAGYCAISFLYFGLRLVLEPGSQYLGRYDDPQILIWSFAWWPHAILHGQNPFVTNAIWPPGGVDLTWSNAIPGLSLLFSPITLTAGPVASYNVAAVLMPALAAWTAFLLCRYLTRAFWPSLVGGYLFGFSSYIVVHEGVQLQLVAVFAIPLVALIVLRYLDGDLGGRGLVVRLGPLIAFELLTSTEFTFTLTLSLALGLILGFLFTHRMRPRIASLAAPLIGAYAVAALLTAPFLYYVFAGFRLSAFNPPEQYVTDLLNLVVPTHLQASGAGWASSISNHFPGNYAERGSFVGPVVLIIVGLFARSRWRTPGGRFLLAALFLTILASLGKELTVDGRGIVPLPTPLGHNTLTVPGLGKHLFPAFNNVLPVRIMLYASLAAGVIVAMWMASRPPGGWARWLLPLLAVLLLVPNPAAGIWAMSYKIPPFFTDSAYRNCLGPRAIVLPEPVSNGGEPLLWQVASDFRFRMTGGRLQGSPPTAFLHPASIAQISVGYLPVRNQVALFTAFFRAKHVTSVIVDESQRDIWAPSLDRIAKGQDIGGVLLYRITGPSTCSGSSVD